MCEEGITLEFLIYMPFVAADGRRMKYYESPVFGEWCKRVYGCDMKQQGVLTVYEMEMLFREVELPLHSAILDVGCGAGYITQAIAGHYKSNVIGIDIDNGVIEYAKAAFGGNPALSFLAADVNEISYAPDTFDMICFIDTLYLAVSIDRLRLTLDKYFNMLKPGGKLVVFWTNQPNKRYNIFDMISPSADNTQVGIWAAEHNVPYQSFDLTGANRLFWSRALQECKALECGLKNEVPDYYKTLFDECTHFAGLCEKGDDGGIFRWLYVLSDRRDV